MPQTDILTWGIIIIADFLSIFFGCFSAYRFIRAFLDKKDLMKYQGYLVCAFLLILVLPLLITFGGLKLVEVTEGDYVQMAIGIQLNDLSGVNNRISFSSKEFVVVPSEENIIDLNIMNDFQERRNFTIDFFCMDEKRKCGVVLDALVASKNKFSINPDVIFKLPISVNLKDSVPADAYVFNITIKDDGGFIYDSIPLTLSVN